MPEQKSSGEVIEVPVYWLWIVLGAVLLFLIGVWLYRHYGRFNEPAPDILPDQIVTSPSPERATILNSLSAPSTMSPATPTRQTMVKSLNSAPTPQVNQQSRASLLNSLP